MAARCRCDAGTTGMMDSSERCRPGAAAPLLAPAPAAPPPAPSPALLLRAAAAAADVAAGRLKV
jgi:hypothetical protein